MTNEPTDQPVDTTVKCPRCGRLLPPMPGVPGDYKCDFCVTYEALEEEIFDGS